ncbi:sigma 54-interacting transcriptional regulator [Desulfosarcina ovata]|uniref:Sigma-54-dependent Fis family transcriptional regulator n=1 Tax=Desulfosarcina ovata subsp. ovata TaxID=2752305 RepID=A0A5K8AK55_9BACT|nr:sigma 54-interacting transcriptional regulator [Desulfosarcina ovata]BBO93103.1 hypothetical protein DSCOOX_62830 [Desulfosarcina ovata subsp. ovata]
MESSDMNGTKTSRGPARSDGKASSRPKNRTFRSVFENTGTGTILIEADMTVAMANACFECLSGITRERIEGRMKLIDFIHPEDQARVEGFHAGRRQGHSVPSDYGCRLITSHNGERHMAVRAQLIAGTTRSVVSFMDITDLVQSKEALERSKKWLVRLMNNLPGMVYRYSIDAGYRFQFASQGGYGLTGYRPGQLTGDRGPTYIDLIHPDDRREVLASVETALDRETPFQLTYRIQTVSDGEKWVWDQGAGVRSPEGGVFVEGFITDFTLFKQMEDEFLRREARLKNENEQLWSSAAGVYGFGDLVGKSDAMRQVYGMIAKAAEMDTAVILYGESGTGKELAARRIHAMSSRRSHRFVAVNCGAIPESIFESEFFGYKKGAFSGAIKDSEGLLDTADGGTLFLDEVGEISLAGQVKLLRVIDQLGYTPVGGRREKHPNLRIIAATNKDLKQLVKNGDMREDFFFRIHIFPIHMPPLRSRKEDLPLLIDRVIETCPHDTVPPPAGSVLRQLMAYDWPGNVRELKNTIQRYLLTGRIDFFTTEPAAATTPPPDANAPPMPLKMKMREYESEYIRQVLDKHHWNRSKVAKMLGIDRKTLLRKIRDFNID